MQFACNMNALTPAQRSLHNKLVELLRLRLSAQHDLTDGYEFEFPFDPEAYDALTLLTPLEHACCPFFTINIRVEDHKLFWRLAGNEGVKQFIRMEFAPWFQ